MRHSSNVFWILLFALFGCSSQSNSVIHTVVVLGSYSASSTPAAQANNPTLLNIRAYALYVSENADCSSPVEWRRYGPSGKLFNVYAVATPDLVSARPNPAGTYQCVIMKMSDTFQFQVNHTVGSCVANTTYHADSYTAGAIIDPDGASTAATDYAVSSVEDPIWIYFTNGAPAVNPGAQFIYPLTNGPFDTSDGTSHQIVFYTDFNGKLNSGGSCTLNSLALGTGGTYGSRAP